ncbi:MAG: hypothetical protein AB7O21_15190 [Gammaproteobacteria bacterium]
MIELAAKLFLWSCWVSTYVLIIRRTQLDRTPGMPFFALCMNLSWEAMMLFVHEFGGPGWITVLVWLLLDIVMFCQYFVYARPRSPRALSERLFWIRSLAVVAAGVGTPVIITLHFQDFAGLIAAYFQNALMSILFCAMILSRDNLAGQSIYIAISKCLGTAVTLIYGEPSNLLLGWCYTLIVTFDLAYIALIYVVARRDGIPVWTRV